MKKRLVIIQFFLAIILISVTGFSCEKSNPSPGNANSPEYQALIAQINSLPKDSLTIQEKENLLWMREEEKLARDVYLTLFDRWNSQVFANISSSEQMHMDAVLTLLNKYNMPDPASNTRGVFNNPTLQQLYNSLVSGGSASLAKALETGATIEDLDLKDLREALAATDNADIQLVYANLQKGSRNHMRAFYSNLQNQGITYIPQYITQAELDVIISSPIESGFRR